MSHAGPRDAQNTHNDSLIQWSRRCAALDASHAVIGCARRPLWRSTATCHKFLRRRESRRCAEPAWLPCLARVSKRLHICMIICGDPLARTHTRGPPGVHTRPREQRACGGRACCFCFFFLKDWTRAGASCRIEERREQAQPPRTPAVSLSCAAPAGSRHWPVRHDPQSSVRCKACGMHPLAPCQHHGGTASGPKCRRSRSRGRAVR